MTTPVRVYCVRHDVELLLHLIDYEPGSSFRDKVFDVLEYPHSRLCDIEVLWDNPYRMTPESFRTRWSPRRLVPLVRRAAASFLQMIRWHR